MAGAGALRFDGNVAEFVALGGYGITDDVCCECRRIDIENGSLAVVIITRTADASMEIRCADLLDRTSAIVFIDRRNALMLVL